MAKENTRNYSLLTIKRLFSLSGNCCAFPGCSVTFLNNDDETNFSNISPLMVEASRFVLNQASVSLAETQGRPHISLSWFKHTATLHLQKMYEMIVILEKYDVIVTRVKRDRCGYIVYEDEYQVSSIPFRIDRKVVL